MRNNRGYHTKIGEIIPGVPLKGAHFFGQGYKNTIRPFGCSYTARISAIFETTDMNQCAGGDNREKFGNFCTGSFAGFQNAFWGLNRQT